jgi:hypothetical protein
MILVEFMSFLTILFWKKTGKANQHFKTVPHSKNKLTILQRKHFMSHRIVPTRGQKIQR